ncbi:hypothetical protein J6590_068850 [Homalodisca vitripennis]|nr:hypothetical protein J6590_068850 [Homalodisca vitripennis]
MPLLTPTHDNDNASPTCHRSSDRGRSKTMDFELKIAQVRILSVILATFINTIDLVVYRLSPLFCLISSSQRPVVHEDG